MTNPESSDLGKLSHVMALEAGEIGFDNWASAESLVKFFGPLFGGDVLDEPGEFVQPFFDCMEVGLQDGFGVVMG